MKEIYEKIVRAMCAYKSEIIEITDEKGFGDLLNATISEMPKYQQKAFNESFFEGKKRCKTRDYGREKALRKLRHPNVSKQLRQFYTVTERK